MCVDVCMYPIFNLTYAPRSLKQTPPHNHAGEPAFHLIHTPPYTTWLTASRQISYRDCSQSHTGTTVNSHLHAKE